MIIAQADRGRKVASKRKQKAESGRQKIEEFASLDARLQAAYWLGLIGVGRMSCAPSS